ncbi:MAG: group III truncated hemoglobin [Spirosomataceae bacterium]
MKKQLESRSDVELLVNQFYEKIRQDPELGLIFEDIAQINWEVHLPKMVDFWEGILFGTLNYNGQPMPPHFRLTTQYTLTPQHFDRWLALFFENVDTFFEGEKAEDVKYRAYSIATIMNARVQQINEQIKVEK